MNQVNITGMIANVPVFREEAGGTPHTILTDSDCFQHQMTVEYWLDQKIPDLPRQKR